MARVVIKTEKLRKDEMLILSSNSFISKEDLEDLNVFNESNFFTIKKIYVNEELKGYAVLFLGYNGLESTDVSLEKLSFYFPDLSLLSIFIKEVMNKESLPIPVDNFYYRRETMDVDICELLEANGFKPAGITR